MIRLMSFITNFNPYPNPKSKFLIRKMGLTFCCPGHKNSKKYPNKVGKSFLEQLTRKPTSNGLRFSLLRSITKLLRPSGLHAASKQEGKEEMRMKKSDNSVSGLLTLEEWILASPCLNSGISAKKVYPSLVDENNIGFGGLICDEYCRESLSMKKVMKKKVDEGDKQIEDSSLSRSQSGKTKKRVSFRMPVVADVFILDSVQGYNK